MKNRKAKKAVTAAASVLGALLLILIAAFIVLGIRTAATREDHSSVYSSEEYRTPVSVQGVEVIEQDVSCGYAVLEMFAAWSGHDLTEESLYREYGRVVTSTGRAFCSEMNRQFPEFRTEMHKYLKDTELIDMVYGSLSLGVPVPFEWAALRGSEWTLHYSLITGMDIPSDRITIANPYGYYEEISVDEFLERTRFDAYKGMPLFLKLGFAFGVFEKNTVFLCVPPEQPESSQENTPAAEPGSRVEITFIGDDKNADVWILPQTDEILKTSLWGTATVADCPADAEQKLALDPSGDSGIYVIRIIAGDGGLYSANDIHLEEGYSIRFSRGKTADDSYLKIIDETGAATDTREHVFEGMLGGAE